jgi:hypothetical protein
MRKPAMVQVIGHLSTNTVLRRNRLDGETGGISRFAQVIPGVHKALQILL